MNSNLCEQISLLKDAPWRNDNEKKHEALKLFAYKSYLVTRLLQLNI